MNDQILESRFQAAADILAKAEALLITAGAGIGVDSGLPDFRGNEGFWRAYPPIAKLRISFPEMANPQWFASDPAFAWAFYGHRLNLYRRTAPHLGFRLLLELGQRMVGGYFVFTSNVDGQFQKAGFDRARIEECHGSIHHFQCVRPCSDAIWDASQIEVMVDEVEFRAQNPLPHCPQCGDMARPNILMFGDWSWIQRRTHEQGIRMVQWLEQLSSTSQRLAIIELGAGTAVPTVRWQSERVAQQLTDTALIRINIREPQVPGPKHVPIPARALEAVSRIFEAVRAW